MAGDPTVESATEPLERVAGRRWKPRANASSALGSARLVLACTRPRQWIKNAFVLAGVIFAGNVLDASSIVAALAVTAAFCLASGATYLLNDVRDADVDRDDPRTSGRPVARGALSPQLALAAAGPLAAAALLLAAAVNAGSMAIVAAYLGLHVAYSWRIKDVVVADLAAIAAGFILRAAAGGVAVEVRVSPWLLIATGSLALFLAVAKRRAQLAGPHRRRPVLARYSPAMLDRAVVAMAAATLAIYVAYAGFGAPTRWMLLSVPFVVFGMLRAMAAIRRDPAQGADPALLVLHDRAMTSCIALWAACAAVVTVASG